MAKVAEIESVTGTNHDGTKWTLKVGDRVDVAADDSDPDSADTGSILRFPSRQEAEVLCSGGNIETINVMSLTHAE